MEAHNDAEAKLHKHAKNGFKHKRALVRPGVVFLEYLAPHLVQNILLAKEGQVINKGKRMSNYQERSQISYVRPP